MIRNVLFFALLAVAALILTVLSIGSIFSAIAELARPGERTRLVYRFVSNGDASTFDALMNVERRRIDSLNGSEVKIERSGEDSLVIEFRPMRSKQVEKNGEVARLSRQGRLRFLFEARASDFTAPVTLESERAKAAAWRAQHPDQPIADFDELDRALGGPVEGLNWYERGSIPAKAKTKPLVALMTPKHEWQFGSGDFRSVRVMTILRKTPEYRYEFDAAHASAFGDFTAAIAHHSMAVVLDDEVLAMTTVTGRLPASGTIPDHRPDSTATDVADTLALLKTGEFSCKPIFVSSEQMAAPPSDRWIGKVVLSVMLLAADVAVLLLLIKRIIKLKQPRPMPDLDWSGASTKSR